MNAADIIKPWENVDEKHPLTMPELRDLTIKHLQAISDLQTRLRRVEEDNRMLNAELHRISEYLIRRAAAERGIPAEIDAGILDVFEINSRPQE